MKMAVSNILQCPFLRLLIAFRPLLRGLVLCVACSSTIQASDSLSKDWEFTGFGTLGYAHSDKYSDLILKRNVSQRSQTIEDNGWLVDSRLGFQLNKEINHHWEVVSQVVAREKTRNTLENSIEMAFLRYRSNQLWELQAGRMPLEIFLLSDHLDVGYSYHWVRPPTEFYGWIPFSYLDGAKTSVEFISPVTNSLIRLDAYGGTTQATLNISYSNGGTSYNTAKANPIFGVGITREKDNLLLRANVTHFKISEDIEAIEALKELVSHPEIQSHWPNAIQIAEDYSLEEAEFDYVSLGLSWTPGDWLVQGEYSDIGSDSYGTYDGQRAYLQLGYRFKQVLPHITYSRSWDYRDYPYDGPPATPQSLPAGTLEALGLALEDNRYSGLVNQYTVSVGIRWDFSTQKALKLQCDRTKLYDGSLGILPTTRSAPRNWQEDTRSWCSATLDWIF
jgi:hypothetical protein